MSKASTTNLPFSRQNKNGASQLSFRSRVITRPFYADDDVRDQILKSSEEYSKKSDPDQFKDEYGAKATYREIKRIRSIVRKWNKKEGSLKADLPFMTQQIPDADIFASIEGAMAQSISAFGQWLIVEPSFPPLAMVRLPIQNNTLGQCIEAMKTNIEGFGYSLEYTGIPEQKEAPDVLAEFAWMDDLLRQPNGDDTLIEIREKMRVDYETLGYACLEIGRDNDGNVTFIYHVEAFTMRMTRLEKDPVAVEIWLRRDGKDYQKTTIDKRFRRYVQMSGGKRVYFKEFGDPRMIDPATGLEVAGLEPDESATEILWVQRYVSGDIYGLPRWINQLPSILGTREAELTNLSFFQDNAIPALAVLVAGGLLTEETVMKIQEQFEVKGRAAINRVLVIEARAPEDQVLLEGVGATVPKLDLKPLAADRQQDALFQEFDKNGQTKVRSSFRLPPIFIGLSEDYTRATAEASLETADSQVFSPERSRFDKLMNNKVLLRGGVPPKFWRFRTNPAKIVSSDGIMKSILAIDKVGGMSPNLAITLANELLDLHIPRIEEAWGDLPYDFVRQLLINGTLVPTGTETAGKIIMPLQGPAPVTPTGKADSKSEVVITARSRSRQMEEKVIE